MIKNYQNNIRIFGVRMVHLVHRVIFGGDAGKQTVRFVKNVSISFFGGIIAFVILFVTNIIVARMLGPEEYGRYTIVFSIAQIIALLFTLELDVSILYFLSEKNVHTQKIISSIMIMFVINVCVFSFLALSSFRFLEYDQISFVAFVSALLIAFVFSLKRLIDALLRSQDRFGVQTVLRLAESICVLGGVLVFFYVIQYVQYHAYIMSIIFGGSVFALVGLYGMRNYISFRHSSVASINQVFQYNVYGLINAVVNGIVKNADTLLVAGFLGVQMAGIYAIYFTASVVFGARMTQLFMNVFFPALRMHDGTIMHVRAKITRLLLMTSVPLMICASIGVGAVVWVYGDAYPFVWQWVVLGGVYITVHFFASLYGWALSSVSQEGYKKYNISFVWSVIIYGTVIGVAFIIGHFAVSTLLIAIILYRLIGGVIAYRALSRIA